MNCNEFVSALSTAIEPSAEVREHGFTCPHCRGLWNADRLLRGSQPPSSPPRTIALSAELQHALNEHHGVTRGSSPWTRVLAVLTTCAACLVFALTFAPRADLLRLSSALLLQPSAAFTAGLLATLLVFFYRGRSGLGAPAWLRWSVVLISVAATQALCSMQLRLWPTTAGLGSFATPHDCLAFGLATVLFVGAAAFVVSRHTALVSPAASGAVAGCSAGWASMLFLYLHCPSQHALHLHVVHGLAPLLAIGIGALLGRRWLAA
jgi:hypothetical protein